MRDRMAQICNRSWSWAGIWFSWGLSNMGIVCPFCIWGNQLREVNFLSSDLAPGGNEVVSLGGAQSWLAPRPSLISLLQVSARLRIQTMPGFPWTWPRPGSQRLSPGIWAGPGADAEWAQAAGVGAFQQNQRHRQVLCQDSFSQSDERLRQQELRKEIPAGLSLFGKSSPRVCWSSGWPGVVVPGIPRVPCHGALLYLEGLSVHRLERCVQRGF